MKEVWYRAFADYTPINYGGGTDEFFCIKVEDENDAAQMKAAFEALQNAGYYMFRVYEYGSWLGYKCSKKPFMNDGERVTEFNDFID